MASFAVVNKAFYAVAAGASAWDLFLVYAAVSLLQLAAAGKLK